MNTKSKLIFVLSVAGILVSAYLVNKTFHPEAVACSIGGGCEAVLSSKYAKIAGIPTAVFGLAWYVGIIIMTWFTLYKRVWAEPIFVVWLLGGIAFSLYLLSLEIFVIHNYCTWCLSSLGLVALITVVFFVRKRSYV